MKLTAPQWQFALWVVGMTSDSVWGIGSMGSD